MQVFLKKKRYAACGTRYEAFEKTDYLQTWRPDGATKTMIDGLGYKHATATRLKIP